ncbi:biotin/lipoyl-binding protein [Halodesulfovibrio marinisediminis]|uniref:Multidrug resistance efflux pump n=1 Tax=Halodesulfovibrio marinisediminis DSM 17456 TaxID=1121457 RepID=A0A1N6DW74_9BACT|nr:biotin/lipoyl-binding protein [Halodesulfovibrio marinisediminis]SIN75011.1 Multidrug resistance efflux pump [Halodesulfovibrio marinisediminis DSM 17456]
MTLRMEGKSQRKSHRISLPAKMNLQGKEYRVLDWSLEGFKAELPQGSLADNWIGEVTFILPLQQMDISFGVKARLRRQEDESAGFSFESLPERSKSLLSAYVKASIEGQLDDVEGIIARVDTLGTPVEIEKPLTISERKQFKRSFLGRAFGHVCLAATVVFLVSFICYNNYSTLRSTRGVISGGLVDAVPQLSGTLKSIKVQEGQNVKKGQLLFTLDDRELLRQGEGIRHELSIERERLEYLYVLLQEEAKAMGLYREAAKNSAARLRLNIEGIDARIALATKEFQRANLLVKTGYVSRSEWDKKQEHLLSLEAKREEVVQQLLLAEENIRSSIDGKYLSDGKAQGKFREIEAQISIQKKVIAKDELRLSSALELLEKTRVLSKVDGFVHATKRISGTFLRSGESVLTIVVDGAKPWVQARFTFQEAKNLFPGAKAQVFIPALGIVCDGTVQALGHYAMGPNESVSQANETRLNEVPVKIILDNPPNGLITGLGVEVSVDIPWRNFLNSIS